MLDEVAGGETIEITRNGKAIAQLVPGSDTRAERSRRANEAWERWKTIREEHNITLGPDMTLKDLMAEAARERDAKMEAMFDRMDERERQRGQQE